MIGVVVVVCLLAVPVPVSAAAPCTFAGGMGRERPAPHTAHPLRYLTDVRAGGHGCFDRASFEFARSDRPAVGFAIGYERAPIQEDGSGRPVTVKGRAFLVVRLSPARDVVMADGRPERTYRGPESVVPARGTRIVEVRHISSFESTVKWAIGVDARRPFRVSTLGWPTRLVVDIG